MNGNSPAKPGDRKEKPTSFIELAKVEKLLWTMIQCKGISHPESRELYHTVRSGYEKLILNDYQTVDLPDVEYTLWKLHYKHIDEFRKKIKKVCETFEGFKSFLSEATDFYKDLIVKFRRTFGLSEERTILERCQYVCHRFLVCLGDLSRYRELCKRSEVQKWAAAAMFYLEATAVWPHSGNPQNQLALLATYVGDDFLALYHCTRSLAVKEPFPDAWDNIMLLFEKNKSSHLPSLSTDAHIDFSKPLERLSSQIKSHPSMEYANTHKLGATKHVPSGKTDLWPLFVRMISFFLVKSSFEDLPHTFASTMVELEAVLALSDVELRSSLEAYEQFDPSRNGPYRALQAVATLVFVLQNLTKTPELKDLKGKKEGEFPSSRVVWAWTCTFSFLGHLVQRCIVAADGSSRPLLPAVLVFVEWYAGMLDHAQTFGEDEKVLNAKSYFFGALVDLLNGLDLTDGGAASRTAALWEDHELRGFEPVSQSNECLDFSTPSGYEAGDSVSIRMRRIRLAATKMAERFMGLSRNPIVFDRSSGKFYVPKDSEKFLKKNESSAEDEEVILFNPLTRYNSEPIKTDETPTSEDGLRRSASSVSDDRETDASRKGPAFSTGPPSLSAWVVNNVVNDTKDVGKERGRKLAPIEEVPISSLANVSVSPPEYIPPAPSAPLLPEDPIWARGSPHGAPAVDRFSPVPEPVGVGSGVPAYRPPVYGMSSSEWLYRYNNNLDLDAPGSSHHWPVYANTDLGNFHGYDGGSRFDLLDRWGNPLLTNRRVYFEDPSLVYGRDEKQREKLVLGYQRPNINGGDGGRGGGGGGGELRAGQWQMKEREWQFQGESPVRGPPYMGKGN